MSPNSEPTEQEFHFETSFQELEKVVSDLESGEIDLELALNRFEEGVKLLKNCHQFIHQAERKIEILTGVDSQGNPVTETFEDKALSLEEKAESRSTLRSSEKSSSPNPETTTSQKTTSVSTSPPPSKSNVSAKKKSSTKNSTSNKSSKRPASKKKPNNPPDIDSSEIPF